MIRCLVLIALLTGAALTRANEAAAPAGPLPDTVVPTNYRLNLSIDPRRAHFSGQTVIEVAIRAPLHTIWLHGLGLKVKSATVTASGHTVSAHYEEIDHDTGVARLVTEAPLAPGTAVLRFDYEAPFQSSPQGLYRTRVGKDWYAFSQMEAIDARRVFPGFDEPRFKTPFVVAIATHGADLAVTNAPELHAAKTPAGTTLRTYETTKPLPTYLIAFAVGPLQIVEGAPVAPNAVRHTPLPLRIIGTQGDAARFQFALAQAPELITRLEDYFAIAFPYPKIDLIASPIHLGAMENAGAIIFGEDYLAFTQPPTPRQQSHFGVVVAHELAHQWFGDLVTPAWWDDIWLNESFAEWMGSKISDQWRPQLGIAQEQLDDTLGAMDTDALRAGRPIHQPVTRNSQISATFDGITYEKGAGVIRMVESYLGEERFQRGVRLHLTRRAYGTATAAEFFAAMAEASGEPGMIDAFESFVNQPGVPLIAVSAAPDGSLLLAQSRYRPLGPAADAPDVRWKIPFCANLYAAGQPRKSCTMLTDATGTLAVPADLRGAIVHPNADGAGYYRFTVDATLWQSLLAMSARLPPREAMTLADSTAAAFSAGRLPFSGLFHAAQVLSNHPDRTTALSLGYQLATLHARMATPAERVLLERALVSLYGERLSKLGYDATPGRYGSEAAEQQLLRRQLIDLVGLTGRDPGVRAALTPFAERSVVDPAAVESLLRGRIWAIGLQERGAPIFENLRKLAISSPDAQVRADAGFALGYAEAAVASNALALTLEPALEVQSAARVIFEQMANPRTREAAWQWFGAHEEAAVGRVPAMFQSFYASVGDSFCSAPERQSFNAVLGARLRALNGGELAVDRTLEGIDSCIALRAALGDSVTLTLQEAVH
jgi:Peptidase family M1 domain/Peptidase M1 N-terminal domain/ERAP1-like C-terminal domain